MHLKDFHCIGHSNKAFQNILATILLEMEVLRKGLAN